MGSEQLAGQVALVAGGSRGLGLLIARELVRRGATVAICARGAGELRRAAADLRRTAAAPRRTAAEPRRTAAELRRTGAQPSEEGGSGGSASPAAGHADVHTFVCDVTDRAAVMSMVGRVGSTLGPVDLLVNVAGIIQVGPLTSMTHEDFELSMATMFWGPVHLSDAVLPSMRARRSGRIATITSIGGKIAVPHLLPYSAAKFAAVGYFEGLSAELAGTGVSVTTVVPGLMRTGSHLHALFTGRQDREYAWFSLGAALPLVSMDAERAARRIVSGTLQGRREILLSPMTKVAARLHGVAPSTTIALMQVMGRMLPSDVRQAQRPVLRVVDGKAADRQLGSTLVRRATVLGRRAAARFNE